MADSAKSRFKSKWGKVFKESDGANAKNAPLQLNDDVVDFLKPSTEKAGMRHANFPPKIDVAIAQRFSDASSEIHLTSSPPLPGERAWVPLKRRRREGLTVGFARAAPDVIGEGGDDAPDPPSEISRRRAAMGRSISDSRPAVYSGAPQWSGAQPLPPTGPGRPPAGAVRREEDFMPQPVRRVHTSHNEFSPPVQIRQAPPKPPPVGPPPDWGLRRAATGPSGEHNDGRSNSPVDSPDQQQHHLSLPRMRPVITTRFDFEDGSDSAPSASSIIQTPQIAFAPPRNTDGALDSPKSPAYAATSAKRRSMRAGEGAALRRLSGMNFVDNAEDVELDPGITGPKDTALLSPDSDASYPRPSPASDLSPESAVMPTNSPFADPRYLAKRNAENARPGGLGPPQLQSNVARAASPFDDPKYIGLHSSEDVQVPQARQMPVRERSETQSSRQGPPPPIVLTGYPQQPDTAFQNPSHPQYNQQPQQRRNFSRPQQSPGLPPDDLQVRPPPAQAQNMSMPQPSLGSRDTSPLRDRVFQNEAPNGSQSPGRYGRRNGSSSSINHFSPQHSHPRSTSREDQMSRVTSNGFAQPNPQIRQPMPQYQSHLRNPSDSSPQASLLAKPAPSPYARNPSPADYFSAPRQSNAHAVRSPAANLKQQEADRPGSSGSLRGMQAMQRASPSPIPTPLESDQNGNAALVDFAHRVAHMKGVFRLTAEKEQPADRCTPKMWLRTAIWWFMKGRSSLDELIHQRQRESASGAATRELLTQAHVDLAKPWWILYDQFGLDETVEDSSMPAPPPGEDFGVAEAKRSGLVLRNQLRSMCLMMANKRLMPPHQSLIQGQDTRIWLEYPRFTPDAAAVLNGQAGRSFIRDDSRQTLDPWEALPFTDTRDVFCYGRFYADVHINTDEAETDRVVLPCVISMLRGKRDYQASVVIASQSELVNVKIGPRQREGQGLTWHDVSWKASLCGMAVRLPRGFDLSVRLSERDFRSLWNFVEYTRKIECGFRAEQNERPVHEARLAEVQYMDSSNPNAFPQENVRGCVALLFEKSERCGTGGELRKTHRGFRFLLVTESGHRMLSSVSHELCRSSPLFFEFRTDPSAAGVALIIKIREFNGRQCRMLLVFPDAAARQAFFDVLNGMDVTPDETIVSKVALESLNIEPGVQAESSSQTSHTALQQLEWQRLGVTNIATNDPTVRVPSTVLSTNLRIVARHIGGCITDRINLGKGELLLRLPCVSKPAIQFLRQPQEDMTMSIDSRHSPQAVVDGISELHRLAREQVTIRTFTFNTPSDLHEFQLAVTGMSVKYDGLAATYGISRRRMVVPIYKKWEASKVRLQVVANAQNTVTQVIAFMEDFSHADAMVIQVKKTDDFESSKGDGKGKKWSVKLKDAKFSLPREPKGEVADAEERVRRRFVNLEGMEYAEEHDDITVGFDSEEERDQFAQALPATTTVGRGLTLKRRI